MRPIIIDSSVGVSIVRHEPEGPPAREILRRAVGRGVPVMVPAHFWLEVTNTLLRRRHWPASDVVQAIHQLDEIEFETIESDRTALLSAVDFAERHRLTSYDAMYLALADAVDGSLMTFDVRLRAAAGPRAMSPDTGGLLSDAPVAYDHDVTWPRYKGASALLAKFRADALRDGST